MEDVITDGKRMHRSFPYPHFISRMISRIGFDPQRPTSHFALYDSGKQTYYKLYKASAPSVRPVRDTPPVGQSTATGGAPEVEGEGEDDSNDSDDERPRHPSPLAHDFEVGGSRDPPPPPPPPPQVTAAQVATTTDIASILQVMMAQQQRSDQHFEALVPQ